MRARLRSGGHGRRPSAQGPLAARACGLVSVLFGLPPFLPEPPAVFRRFRSASRRASPPLLIDRRIRGRRCCPTRCEYRRTAAASLQLQYRTGLLGYMTPRQLPILQATGSPLHAAGAGATWISVRNATPTGMSKLTRYLALCAGPEDCPAVAARKHQPGASPVAAPNLY
jgi:hypothetical protein